MDKYLSRQVQTLLTYTEGAIAVLACLLIYATQATIKPSSALGPMTITLGLIQALVVHGMFVEIPKGTREVY